MTHRPAITMDVPAWTMLLALAAVWGGSFFFVEIALRELPPLTITLHRVFWAVPVLWLIVRLRGLPVPTSPRIWGGYLVMGLLNNVIPFSLINWGQQSIDAGLASILNGTSAMFAAVVAGLLLKDEPLTWNRIAGALISLMGVAAIMGPEAVSQFDLANLGQIAVLGAAFSYALSGTWGRAALSSQPPLMNACGMVTASTLMMIPLVLVVDGPPRVGLSAEVWGAVLGIALVSTVLAYVLYFAIMARAGVANLLLVTLLIPPFAIALGVAFLGERLEANALLGFAIIAAGFVVTDGRVFRRRARA